MSEQLFNQNKPQEPCPAQCTRVTEHMCLLAQPNCARTLHRKYTTAQSRASVSKEHVCCSIIQQAALSREDYWKLLPSLEEMRITYKLDPEIVYMVGQVACVKSGLLHTNLHCMKFETWGMLCGLPSLLLAASTHVAGVEWQGGGAEGHVL